jgi:hypothetical protein
METVDRSETIDIAAAGRFVAREGLTIADMESDPAEIRYVDLPPGGAQFESAGQVLPFRTLAATAQLITEDQNQAYCSGRQGILCRWRRRCHQLV